MTNNSNGNYDQEFIAQNYDAFYDRMHRPDIDFYVDCSRQAQGRTLELGCGTGRVLIPTAIAGCQITGLEFAIRMLQRCREKLAQQPLEVQARVQLIQGDMTNFNLPEKFALITIPFRPFQHLIDVRAQTACLEHVHHHLTQDGLLVFDIFHPSLPRLTDTRYLMEMDVEPEMELPDGRIIRRTNRTAGFHPAEQYNDIELIHYIRYPDGRQERMVHAFPMRYFFRAEMEHLLKRCRFEVVNFYGNFDKTPFTADSPEMIFVAKKAAQ